MIRRIFITGGTGKTGQALLRRLAVENIPITCLCRTGGRFELLERFDVRIAEGDASDAESLSAAYGGEETVIHLSSIFHTASVLEGCFGMKRLIAVSSTGVFSKYRRAAGAIAEAERAIASSGLDYTILRPTMIFGTPDDRNMSRLIRLVRRRRIIPLPAAGRSVFQPVHADDLASCIVASLASKTSVGKSYNVPGGSAHSLREIVSIIAGLLGKRVHVAPVPLGAALLAVRLAKSLRPGMRLDTEQVERLRENKSFDYSEAARDVGYAPMSFPDGVRRQIVEMGYA